MATDLEKLVVQLSADIKGYERELKRAGSVTDRETRKMEQRFAKANKTIASALQSMPLPFGRAGGPLAIAGAFALLTRETVRVAQKMDDLADAAENVGIDPEELQSLTIAFRQLGGDVADVVPALQKFSEELGEAQRGSGELKKLFDANGVSLKDAAGNFRPLNEMLREFADLVARAPTREMQQDLVKMATGARSLAPAFAAGSNEIERLQGEAKDAGKVIDNELIRKAAEFSERWQSGAEVATGLWDAFFVRLAAHSEKVIEDLTSDWDRLIEHFNPSGLQGQVTELTRQIQIEQAQLAQEESLSLVSAEKRAQAEAHINDLIRQREGLIQRMAGMGGYDPLSSVRAPGAPATTVPPTGGGASLGELRQLQATLAEKRKLPLNDELREALEYAAKINNLIIEVTSGGQAAKGTPGPRTGSTRHDLGRAADIQIRDPVTGQLLDANNPADLVRINQLLETLAAAGLTGFGGPGYMGPTKVHVGYGTTATWGGMPLSTQAAINRGMANPAYVAGVEGARLAAAQDAADAEIKAAEDAAKAREKELEDIERKKEALDEILSDREQELVLAELETKAVGGSTEELEKQRIFLEEINRLKASGNELSAEQVALAWQHAEALASQHAATATAEETQQATVDRLDAMRDLSRDVLGGVVSDLRAGASAGEIFANVLDKLIAKLADLSVDWLTSALFGPQGTAMPGILGTLFGGFRQHGGPVQAGRSYVVGEGGKPELFVPSTPGTIVPSVNAMGSRAPTVMGGELRGAFDIAPSPLFAITVRSTTAAMIAENNRRLPSYLSERQRRGI